jgi:hypothetical protein
LRTQCIAAAAASKDPAAAAIQVRQAAEQLAEAMEAAAGTGLSQEAVAELKHIHSLAEQVNTTLKKEARLQALRWALTNVKAMNQSGSWLLEDFTYTYNWSTNTTMKASEAITSALLSAMEDRGYVFQKKLPQGKDAHDQAARARNTLKLQVYRLTGIQPRLVDDGDKGWSIYIN